MADDTDSHTLAIQIANQIINIANKRLSEGMRPDDIAAGLRHAAGNFTAFSVANSADAGDVNPVDFAEEFLSIYGYYLERHSAGQQKTTGLEALIRQVQDET